MAEILQVSHSTLLKHLREDLQFQSFHLRWVPHLLTPELREQRGTYANEMIPILAAADRDWWRHLSREMSLGSFSPILRVGCESSVEMALLQSRSTIFASRKSCLQ
jgi:hypothetical protein